MKTISLFIVALLFLITACNPVLPPKETVVVASQPADLTPLALPTVTLPAPLQTQPTSASPAELKYKLREEFPDLFFCDPDYYPVARADELDLATQRFPELQADQDEFQAILNHTGLANLSNFTDEQKLLIYQEHKLLAAILLEPVGDSYRFQLQIAENEGQGFLVTGMIDTSGSIIVQDRQPGIAACPICLAADTQIDTPGGSVAVEDLKPGDLVYTADAAGRRISAPIAEVVRVVVPADHQVVRLVLDDGRQLLVSPGHPTIDGRTIGELQAGDLLEGRQVHPHFGGNVVSSERLPYDLPATYDILPSSGTGWYWANGILIASSLTPPPPSAPRQPRPAAHD